VQTDYSILIVEDEDIIRQGLAKIIGRLDLPIGTITEAGDGPSAVRLFRERKPHIVLTDIRMPGMSGLDVIKEIRKHDSRARIVILSGYGEFEYARTAIRFGVTDYLLKPVKKSILREVLQRAIHAVGAASTEAGPEARPTGSSLGAVGLALSYLADHYADNPGLEEVARHVALNPNYFSSLFRRRAGVRFSRYLQELKVDKAKELLLDPRNKIYRISASVGFNDEKYFCRVFKKLTGQTPKEYRMHRQRSTA